MEQVLPFLLILLLPLFFMGVSALLGIVSGWRALHRRFGPVPGPVIKGPGLWSGRVGLVNYNNALRVGVHPQGLFLSVLFLFRSGHPALFIPQSGFGVPEKRGILFSKYVRVEVGKPKITTLMLPLKAVRGSFLDPEAVQGPDLRDA